MSTVLELKASEPKGRVEDRRLLTGRGRYVDDLKAQGQAYMGIVRSPFAHAKIGHIDFSKARASPDFIASLTGEDLIKEGVTTILQNQWGSAQKSATRYHLAVGKVRFAGEPVAAVLVRRKNSVEDLVEQVEVDYEALPAVTTIDESKKGTTLIYEDWGDNVSQSSDEKWGDAEKVIASAPHVIRAREGIARQGAIPMEPRSVLASYKSKEDLYEVYATVQTVHGLRVRLASELQIPEEKFHVMVMDMGGGFGSKGAQSYPEPLLACMFSRKTGLPVKWTATRTEEFLEAASGRDEYCDVTLACDKDGKVVALKANMECDVGVTGTMNGMSGLSVWTMLGPYRIPNVDVHLTVYATNKTPIGPVRGAGAPEGCYFIERAMNILAQEMGIDPLELRRRNAQGKTAASHGAGRESSGKVDNLRLMDDLVKHSRYAELLKWREDLNSRFKQQGPSHSSLVGGLGISFGGRIGFGGDESEEAEESQWQKDGDEQQSWNESEGEESSAELDFMSESAKVTLKKNGTVVVYTGSSPHGQGEETTFAQLASEELGIPFEMVSVVWGDTSLISSGIGTFGSRSAATGGSAVVDACRKLKSQLFAKIAPVMGTEAKDLSIQGGMLVNVLRPNAKPVTIEDSLEKLGTNEVSASSSFRLSSMDYSTGIHLCAITLDPELGKVKIAKYVVVEDCGRMINKTIVEGQLQGGVVHAVGGSLFEKFAYDDHGNPLASTFMDYCIPTALDSPNVEIFHEVTPSRVTLNGVRGVGESGTIVGYAAVMNAINDALSQVQPGAQVNLAPATPDSICGALETDSASPPKKPGTGRS